MDGHFILVKLSQATVLLPIIAGITRYRVCSSPWRFLFWFYLFSAGVEVTASYFFIRYKNNMPVLHVFTVVEMCSYLWVYAKLFGSSPVIKKISYAGILMVFILAFCEAVLVDGIWKFNTLTRSTGALVLVILTLYQLNLILRNLNDPFLLRKPDFWLLIGVLFYFATSFFFFIFLRISLAHNMEVFRLADTVHILMNIVCNAIFGYAFICHRRIIL